MRLSGSLRLCCPPQKRHHDVCVGVQRARNFLFNCANNWYWSLIYLMSEINNSLKSNLALGFGFQIWIPYLGGTGTIQKFFWIVKSRFFNVYLRRNHDSVAFLTLPACLKNPWLDTKIFSQNSQLFSGFPKTFYIQAPLPTRLLLSVSFAEENSIPYGLWPP